MIRSLVIILVMLSMVANASAQALPVRIGQEIAAVIKSKVGARGFAANDPRYGATVGAVGAAVTEIALGVAAAGTAPAWGTILASAAIAGALGYGISALTGWLFNKDGTVNIPGTPAAAPATTPASPLNYAYINWGGVIRYAGTAQDMLTWYNAVVMKGVSPRTLVSNGCVSQWGGTACLFYTSSDNNPIWEYRGVTSGQIPASYVCASGFVYAPGSGCEAIPSTGTGKPPATKPVADALAGLSDAEKAKPLPAKAVADIADAAFKQAASEPGYAGVPYSMTDPVTEADVSVSRAANPSIQPSTIGDLAQPIQQTNPLGEPASSSNSGTNPAASNPLTNLGTDPGIGAPSLEATPTAQQIIEPLAGMGPTLRSWTVPAHQAACPTPAFDLFGKHIVMDQQCSMFESNRATLYNAMLVAWVLIALFIILSA